MNRLILHSNSVAGWRALVLDACDKCNIKVSEEVESYLVFLLMRTINSTSLLKKIMALELLSSFHQLSSRKKQILQTVGDSCLLFSGLFPGYARKRRVRISYYVQLGQTAYDLLSEYAEQNVVDLFSSLCKQFVPLMDILQSMRELNNVQEQQSLDLLQAEELWHDTNSKHALQVLQEFSNAPLLVRTELMSKVRH